MKTTTHPTRTAGWNFAGEGSSVEDGEEREVRRGRGFIDTSWDDGVFGYADGKVKSGFITLTS